MLLISHGNCIGEIIFDSVLRLSHVFHAMDTSIHIDGADKYSLYKTEAVAGYPRAKDGDFLFSFSGKDIKKCELFDKQVPDIYGAVATLTIDTGTNRATTEAVYLFDGLKNFKEEQQYLKYLDMPYHEKIVYLKSLLQKANQ